MQLKAGNPTQGNEARGTKQAAPERLGVGNGLTGLFLNHCQQEATARAAKHPPCNSAEAWDLPGVGSWLRAHRESSIPASHPNDKGRHDCLPSPSVKSYASFITEDTRGTSSSSSLEHMAGLAPAGTGRQLLLQLLSKLTLASHCNQNKGRFLSLYRLESTHLLLCALLS